MAVTVTPQAAEEVRKLIIKENLPPETSGLRVGVKGGGCSGFEYTMALAEAPGASDKIFECEGVKLFVDPKSFLYINGTQLDFMDTLMKRGFVFTNPNAEKTCGCGKSFGV